MLQKETSAQEELTSHLNIQISMPLSPTTTRGNTTQSAEEKESHLAKAQLGFIDGFAEPLWNIGATLFFPGMAHGLEQIRENRKAWVRNVSPVVPTSDTGHEKGSSVSTVTSVAGTVELKSEEPPGTSETPKGASSGTVGSVRKISSSGDLNEDSRKPRVRKERSLSSFIFWRRKGAHQNKLLS